MYIIRDLPDPVGDSKIALCDLVAFLNASI
jgi:hypothetical protein